MQTAYISHPACSKHDMGLAHPESPRRIQAVREQLVASRLFPSLLQYEAPLATREHLARVHDETYIDRIEAVAPQSGLVHLDPDTALGPHSLEAALRAAGAAVLGTALVLEGKAGNAFCNVRPPGHHATRNSAMGFCIFNNVAIGVAHAIAQYAVARAAIMDFDVHHGNGTEDIFRDDPRVLLCSTFQHPFYPHRGADSGNEHIVNVPLPAGTGGDGFRTAVIERWLPVLNDFRPQIVFISAGFDAHRDDGMAGLLLQEQDYAWVTGQIKTLAEKHCEGRIVSVLEGGYDLGALGRSAAAHVKALGG